MASHRSVRVLAPLRQGCRAAFAVKQGAHGQRRLFTVSACPSQPRMDSRASRAACRKDLWWRRKRDFPENPSQAPPFYPAHTEHVARGTEGSNPFPSTSESTANLTFRAHPFARRGRRDRNGGWHVTSDRHHHPCSPARVTVIYRVLPSLIRPRT